MSPVSGRKVLLTGWLIGVSTMSPMPTQAQDMDLDRVETLTAEGRFGSARDVLQQWLQADEEGVAWSDQQRGTWLRALLTVDPEMAEQDLRRLVVQYPGGPFSDQALLRLAQSARAQSQDSRALQYLEMLLRDYPESRLRAQAGALQRQIEESRSPSGSEVGIDPDSAR